MNFLEKDLEEIIFLSDKKALRERGLFIQDATRFKRQLKIGNYGIADLVSIRRPFYNPYMNELQKGDICVYELKKDKIGISTFLQALGYVKGIQRYLIKRGKYENYDYKIRLIGKDFDSHSAFVYMPDIINNYNNYTDHIDRDSIFTMESYTYSYGIDGMKFNIIEDYSLINEGF